DAPWMVQVDAPPATLDPHCDTRVSSLIDQMVADGSTGTISGPGFPGSTDHRTPTVVHVTLDPNLMTEDYNQLDSFGATETAIGQWQYLLNSVNAGIVFKIEILPRAGVDALQDMWEARAHGVQE